MGVIKLAFEKGIIKFDFLKLTAGIIGLIGAIFLMVGLTTPHSILPNNTYHPGYFFFEP